MEPDPTTVAAFAMAKAAVVERIAMACSRVGRDPASVTLVAVSKTVDAERLRAAVAAGLTTLGENRVQEAAAKVALVSGADWHLVGHLQSNKVRLALDLFETIQSVDSVELATRLDRLASEGPPGSVKSDVATKKPSSSTLIGSWGRRRLAGPKMGLALSVIKNCDWWQGQSSRLVCCS